jgi:hypothetical protein
VALPSSILPSTTAEVLAEQDALKASSSFRRLPPKELPSFIVSLTSKIAGESVDLKKLYSKNLALRQTYYSHLVRASKLESSLLILAIKSDKLEKLSSPQLRVEYINRLSHLIMIFMGKYNLILKDVPKTDIIANKLGKDVYFHLMKRLPSLVTLIESSDAAESLKAFNDALYYIKSSVMHPLTRFVSLLLGELSSSGSRPDIDKREFKREQKADKAALKEDFRRNKNFYKAKWSSLRNEASATLSNLEIEASISSNSSKTRDILNERRARIDNFIYSLEQGIQSINNSNFEGFVSAKVAIEDSLIEYSKRLEFRTLARKSRDIDEAFRLKNKPKDRRTTRPSSSTSYPSIFGSKKKKLSGAARLDSYVHGVLKHLGPAGLALYAGYKVVNNPITRTLIGKPLKYLVAKPIKYLGYKALEGAGVLASSTGRLLASSLSDLATGAFSLSGRVIRSAGSGSVRGIKASGKYLGSLGNRVATKVSDLRSRPKGASSLISRTMYGTGYGVGSAVRKAKSSVGLISNFVKNSFSPISLASSVPSKSEPDMSGLEPTYAKPTIPPDSETTTGTPNSTPSKKPGFPLDLLKQPTELPVLNSGKVSAGFPLSILSRPTQLPKMNSGLSAPRAELFIDDVLDRIDEHVPYIPADLTEQDFSLEDLKEVVSDALEEFLSGVTTSKDKSKLSTTVQDETTNPLSSIHTSVTVDSKQTSVLNELRSEQVEDKKIDTVHESKLTELLLASEHIQEQLEVLDKHLDKILADTAKTSNPYAESKVWNFIKANAVIDKILTKPTTGLKTVISYTVDNAYKKIALSPSKSKDELLAEDSYRAEERNDRAKLVSAVQRISRSKSRSGQTGGINLSGMLSGLIGSPLITKAISSIEAVIGGGTGKLIKSVLPNIAKYAPRLASFALPAVALAGSAYAGWELGTKLYDKYSTEILDAIDSVINTATNIVQGLKDGYDYVVGLLQKPADKLKATGTKLSNWWDTNPISRGAEYISKGASRAATIVSDKVGQVGTSVKSAVGSTVDSISTSASGAKTYISSSVGKLFSTNKSSVDFDNLDPTVKSSFESMAQEYRANGGTKPLSIESARRSTEQQAKLYAANPTIAAKPGHSLHEQGKALDIDRATAGELESMGLLSKYGFARNVKGEPWHLSYVGQQSVPPVATSNTTRTQVQTSPTSVKPTYETSAAKPASSSTPIVPSIVPSAPSQQSSKIDTFSFLDSSFFIMNAGMMAS